jgi:hypothetical protein
MEAAGAEALLEANIEKANSEGWLKLQWQAFDLRFVILTHPLIHHWSLSRWKLLLAPKGLSDGADQLTPKRLPRDKSIIDVFADFLDYLFHCAKEYIVDSHACGDLMWGALESGIEFILTHPNGWEGSQQTMMRRAAIRAGLVPDTDEGQARIHFVTEGEASFNYCATAPASIDALQVRTTLLSRHDIFLTSTIGRTNRPSYRCRRWYY